jgi:hypothetical protein
LEPRNGLRRRPASGNCGQWNRLRRVVDWDRNWYEETISSAFVESTINQIVSKRMVKRQQMRWTPRGAHLLLQVRTRVLDDELTAAFRRWYPSFDHVADSRELAA